MNASTSQLEGDFIQMVQRHQRLVYKVCSLYTDDVEERKDLFQEILLQAWKAYPGYRGDAAISTWLYRVSLNTAIGYRRKRSRGPDIVYPELLHHHPEDVLTETDREHYKLLQQMIAGLPPLDKALVLLYLEDKSYNEIAAVMGISASNVGTRLNRIKEKMKQQAQKQV